MTDTIRLIESVASYHAHVSFDGADERAMAELLCTEIGERFVV